MMEPASEPACLDCQSVGAQWETARWPVTCINWFDGQSDPEQTLHLVIGTMEPRWQAGECTHRPDHVNTHKEDIGQPLRCVESNLACVDGKAQLTACDRHLNSSISSLTACLTSNFPGQITHRTPSCTDEATTTATQQCETASSCGDHHLTNSLVELVARPPLDTFPSSRVLRLLESFPLSVTCIDAPTMHCCTELHNHHQATNCAHSTQGQTAPWCTTCCSRQCTAGDVDSDSSYSSPVESTFRLYCVDKSVSISEQSAANETQDLNSICKYLPTSDRSDLSQRPGRSRGGLSPASGEQTFEEAHKDARHDVAQAAESTARYRVSLPSPAKTCTVRPPLASVFYHLLLFVLLICQLQPPVQSSANIRAIEKRILDSIIGDGRYDSRIRPMGNATVGARGGDGPAIVNVNLLIRSISRIDDVVMEYSVQVTFRQQWLDSRLKFDNMGGQIRYLVLTDPAKVWRPDLFFKNEKEGHFHSIILPNVLLRIYPEGGVLYSIRISLVLACPMNLKYYPLDKQICSIQMASYGYTTEDLMFIWKKEDAVQVATDMELPRFTLEKYLTDYCTSKTNTGSYSCLKVDLLFKREFSYYLIQIYIPCCMLVIVSWVSFWLDPNAIPARVSLGVTTLLTMATSISGINSSLPPVSYTKAIDVWTGVCLTFVFGALLEFALVNYASRSDAHRAALKQQQAAFAAQRKWDLEHAAALEADHIEDRSASAFAMRPLVRQHGDGFHGEKMRACEIHVTLPKRNWCKRWLSKFPTRSKRIDVISRIFFPLMFALFNLVYWTTYLFREDMQDLV